MTGRNIAMLQRESYTPSRFTEFLWWLSSAEKEIIIDSVVDRNRYRIIGTTVLGTWAFATLSWTYFFSTLADSFFFSIALGLFMGFIILSIDRALIKGITKFNKRKLVPLLFRGLLALTIGTFMAQPVVLYMFDKEIRLQASLDNENRKIAKRQELDQLFKDQKKELVFKKEILQKDLDERYEAVQKARQNYINETDGSGGTGKIGIKDIAIAKRTEYQKLDTDYNTFLIIAQPSIDSAEAGLTKIEKDIKKSEMAFESLLNDGFLTRAEALNNIVNTNPALAFRYYLVVFILMLIELMPVIAKTLLPSGSYDEKVMLREALEIEIANTNIKHEQQLKEFYNKTASENNEATITAFFSLTKADREEKIKALSKKWKEEDQASFDGFWEKMKREVLTKQEN